jgi:hypothetical protein
MVRSYKSVTKNIRLFNFLIETNILYDICSLKYKTLGKTTEYVHHYGWHNIHLYAIGIYKLNNNNEIAFDYCYEMDPKNTKNIKKVIHYNLQIL